MTNLLFHLLFTALLLYYFLWVAVTQPELTFHFLVPDRNCAETTKMPVLVPLLSGGTIL